jgi:general secretion pathway protein A
MYTAFYSLQKKPFSMSPDPSFLYMTRQHREGLTGLTYAILERKGFLVLSGMAGVGKTTLLAWVLQKLPSDKVQSSVILNPTLTREEFLELALLDFGMTDIPASKARRLLMLQSFLLKNREEGKVSVLIVDEAHKLSYELLEEVRLLGNFEYGDEKLIQILLLGQRELDDVLNRPDLAQLKQRISVRLSVDALSAQDLEHYIQHRWSVAGGSSHPFTPEAILHINKWSKGVPRLINSICDNALATAFADESLSVRSTHVDSAAQDLRLIERPPAPAIAAPIAPSAAVPATVGAAAAVAAGPIAARLPVVTPLNGHSTAGKATTPLSILERRATPPHKRSLWFRWADKLGLSRD